MADTPKIQLWIEDSGATTAEIQSGCDAAVEYLQSKGFTVHEAFAAVCGEIDNQAAADAWFDAERLAFDITFADWSDVPETAILALG